ncbi:hypothetical protein BGZ82_008238 [Podila clonocystis]|nr:hypothetical protein BGZ82_008238 [Podila clonocystis]
MRCPKRLPLILSVLALPLIILAGVDAKKDNARDIEAFEPALWQLHAHGNHHLSKNHHHHTSKKSKKSHSGHKKNKRAVDASIVGIAGAEPEVWQLRAHGHHHQLKKQQQKVGKAKQQQNKKAQAKRALQARDLKQQRVLAAQEEEEEMIDIAHHGQHKKKHGGDKKHQNHEDEEHNKYDVDPADELLDDYKQKHGGKTATGEDDGADKKEGKDGKKGKNGKEGKEGKDGKGDKKGGKEGKEGKEGGKGGKEGKEGGKGGKKDGKAPNNGNAAAGDDKAAPAKGKAPNGKDPVDGKAPADGKAPSDSKAPADGKTPGSGKAPGNGKPPATGIKPPAAGAKPIPGAPPAVAKPASPIVPVQHMGEFLTKCNTPGQISLTFSEGPSEATTQMLEILKEAKARVTFFANATWLDYMQYAGVTRRAYNDGHLIGMTYRIPNDSSKSMTDAELRADIGKQSSKIHDLIGKYPKYVRLHDASLKDPKLEPAMRDMGYTLVGFNLDEADYKFNTREQASQIAQVYETTFVKQADAFGRKGSYVVVGYDIPATGAAAALPDVISTVIRNEYDMVRLDGCVNDKMPYKKSPMANDGFVGDEFSFGGAKYVHGQSPVAVQNGKAVPGKMPAKVATQPSGAERLVGKASAVVAAVVGVVALAL